MHCHKVLQLVYSQELAAEVDHLQVSFQAQVDLLQGYFSAQMGLLQVQAVVLHLVYSQEHVVEAQVATEQ